MSTGKANTMRRTRPPASSREALGRWGLKGGFAGAATRGSMNAYTAEHYNADVDAGVIETGDRCCARRRPERECPVTMPGPRLKGESHVADPAVTHSLWTRRATIGAWTADGARPIRTLIFERLPVCYCCRMYMYWADRQTMFAAIGFDHGLGYVRPAFGIREQWGRAAAQELQQYAEMRYVPDDGSGTSEDPAPIDEHDVAPARARDVEQIYGDGRLRSYLESLEAAEELYQRERAAIKTLAGSSLDDELPRTDPERMDRYQQATLLNWIRHCLTCYVAVRAALPQPTPRVRLMG